MALVAQKIPLVFRSLNSKTDPRHLLVGDLVSLQNVDLAAWPRLRKRPGCQRLGTLPSGSLATAFKNQLFLGTGAEAYSLAAGSGSLVDKGLLESLSLSALPVRRDSYVQTTPDVAVHPAGITIYTWETTAGGAQYSVFDSVSGQPIVSAVSLGSTASKPKPLALGANVVILWYDTALNHLRYLAIPAVSPATPTAAADFATDPATSQIFDATVIGGLQGSLFVAYANNGASNKISVRYLTATLTLSAELIPTTAEAFSVCCSVFGDPSGQRVWVAYYTGSAVKVFIYDFYLANLLGSFTTVDAAPGTVRNLSGLAPTGSTAQLFYEATGSQTYNNLVRNAAVVFAPDPPGLTSAVGSITGGTLAARTYYYVVTALGTTGETLASNEKSATVASGVTGSVALAWTAVAGATGYRVYRGVTAGSEFVYYAPGNVTTYTDTNATSTGGSPPAANSFVGITSAPAILVRSIGLASKPFYYLGRVHFLAAYQSALQSTYFLVSGAAVVAKLAPGLGGGLTAKSTLPEAPNPSTGVYSTAYLQADQLSSSGGNVFSQAGVMGGTFDFTQPQAAVELSDDLHLAGGILSMYDGAAVVEHGFHLYPENVSATPSGTGGSILAGQYQYVVVWEWMDAQGLLHQSSPSPPVQVTTTGSTSSVALTIPTLRLTAKASPISVVVYRTQANQGVLFRLTSISSPLLNTTSADTVSYSDTAADTAIGGNAQLVMNPLNQSAEVPNLAAPALQYAWRYRNRVAAIPAENPYQWIFSKAFVAGVPIEFNDQQLYQSVAQDGGPLKCGIEMDEKNILFSPSRIYYVVGDGPAPNGTGPDYGSSPQNIPTDVGCTNGRSLVLTPAGVMFQAANGKGIYLLSRGLTVEYIGAPVEPFNGLTVTAAKLAQDDRRVVFYTDGGVALVYDYFVGKWIVYTNEGAADAALYRGLLTFVRAGGTILQETPGVFTDDGNPVLIGLTTSILSFAGIGGVQRVYRLIVRGDYRSAHLLQVSIAYDDDPATTQTETADAKALLGPGATADTVLGGTENPGGGAFPAYDWVVKLRQQKCTSLQITISEAQVGPTYGEGFSLSGLTFWVGEKRGLHRTAAARSI